MRGHVFTLSCSNGGLPPIGSCALEFHWCCLLPPRGAHAQTLHAYLSRLACLVVVVFGTPVGRCRELGMQRLGGWHARGLCAAECMMYGHALVGNSVAMPTVCA